MKNETELEDLTKDIFGLQTEYVLSIFQSYSQILANLLPEDFDWTLRDLIIERIKKGHPVDEVIEYSMGYPYLITSIKLEGFVEPSEFSMDIRITEDNSKVQNFHIRTEVIGYLYVRNRIDGKWKGPHIEIKVTKTYIRASLHFDTGGLELGGYYEHQAEVALKSGLKTIKWKR